jgi:hypothetical protein
MGKSQEQEECDSLNMLFLLFEIDAYLWYGAANPSPYYLSWRRVRRGKLYRRWFTRVESAERYAKKHLFKPPTV